MVAATSRSPGRRPTETRCVGWPARRRTSRRPHAVEDCPTARRACRLRARRSGGHARYAPRPPRRGDQLLLGELADRLQHREPGSARGPVGDEQRLAHQRIQQIKDGVIVGSSNPATAQALSRSNPPANTEHRSSSAFSGIVEQVVGPLPRRGAASGGVQGPAATRPAAGIGHRDDHAPPSAVIDAIRDAANSMANGIPSRRRQISPTVRSDRLRSPARHCGHARRTDSTAVPTVQRSHRATTARRRPRVLHGWWPGPSPSPTAREWPRSDRPRHRGRARSCRTPAAGPGPPARRPPTPVTRLARLLRDTQHRGDRIGHRGRIGRPRPVRKAIPRLGIRQPAARQPPVQAGSCRRHRLRSSVTNRCARSASLISATSESRPTKLVDRGPQVPRTRIERPQRRKVRHASPAPAAETARPDSARPAAAAAPDSTRSTPLSRPAVESATRI